MIVYFSGTGNTKYCAERLAEMLGETLRPITVADLTEPGSACVRTADKRVVWMFPTYSWGMPKQVRRLLRKAQIEAPGDAEHWMVTTCGDDIGKTATQWRRAVERRGLKAATAFSVQMPNTYTFMKGFDVDSAELAKSKVEAASARLQHIAEVIAAGKIVADEVTEGGWAFLKTAVVYPLFYAFCTSPKPFYANDDCINCGLCMKACPMENIAPGADARPFWRDNCMLCSRCYHICPRHAVQYGKTTVGKGQCRLFVSGMLKK
jgi:ferredoxin